MATSLNAVAQDAQLEKLSAKGKDLRMTVVGSSIASGVNDHGLPSSNQSYSYPSLLSKQMNLSNFNKNSLTYRKTESTSNYSLPYLKIIDLTYDLKSGGNPLCERKFLPYYSKLIDNDTTMVIDFLKNEFSINKPDFFIMDLGFQDLISFVENGGFGRNISYLAGADYYPQLTLIEQLTRDKTKGVLFTIPDVLKFPAFNNSLHEKAKLVHQIDNLYILNKNNTLRPSKAGDILLSNKQNEMLLNPEDKHQQGLSPDNPLNDRDVFSLEEQQDLRTFSPHIYNERIIGSWAEKFDLAVVDLFELYEQIFSGKYITVDGISVDPDINTGNFFSKDGLHPTPFGQAIITNETIKAINKKYGTNIQFINTSSFLN